MKVQILGTGCPKCRTLAANSSVDAMLAQCLACEPPYAVMMDEAAAESLRRSESA